MDRKVIIVTHDGLFHADECFAVAALLIFLDKAPVVAAVLRARDEDLIRAADFVVDVGSRHEAEKNRFDHHQEGGAGQRINGIPYASFGLVWQKFGVQIAGSQESAEIVDKTLVSAIDANDTGVDLYKKVFSDTLPFMVSDFIHNLRPTWQESDLSADGQFFEAVGFARKVLEREIAHAKSAISARATVKEAYEKSVDKRIVTLDAFYPYEETLRTFPEPLFAVFPRTDGSWNVKTVRDDESMFKNRKDLPESWAGKRDGELVSLTGVSDAVFCHTGRFMAVAKTKEGAVSLAKVALGS